MSLDPNLKDPEFPDLNWKNKWTTGT